MAMAIFLSHLHSVGCLLLNEVYLGQRFWNVDLLNFALLGQTPTLALYKFCQAGAGAALRDAVVSCLLIFAQVSPLPGSLPQCDQ